MKTLFVTAFLFLMSVGCASLGDKMGTTFIIKENKDGGRIMLNGNGTWMEAGSRKKAEKDMSKKCPNGYEIVEEGLMERPADVTLSGHTHRMEKYLEFKCK